MKTLIKNLLVIICVAISLFSCQKSPKNLTITDVQFMDYISNPITQEGRWMNCNHNSLNSMNKELEEYKLGLLGKKVYIEHFDKAIKIRIGTDEQVKEFLLTDNGNGSYSNSMIDADIENKLFDKIITLKLNAHQELKYVKNLYSYDSIAQVEYNAAISSGREIEAFDYILDERCFYDKGIIVIVKNK